MLIADQQNGFSGVEGKNKNLPDTFVGRYIFALSLARLFNKHSEISLEKV